MTVAEDIAQANGSYVQNFGDKGSLSLPPTLRLAVVTCMDARINPAASLGLKEGEAHIIRNAGGRATEALRSVIISQRLLGTRDIMVVHHTDCGMRKFTDAELREQLKNGAAAGVAPLVDSIAFLPFVNEEKAKEELEAIKKDVREDVAYLKSSPLVLSESAISGWIYDVKCGTVTEVV